MISAYLKSKGVLTFKKPWVSEVMKNLRGSAKLLFLIFASCGLIFACALLPSRNVRWFFQRTSRILCALLGVRIFVRGAKGSDLSARKMSSCVGTLVMANHVSYLDAVVLSALFPCTFVAKSEVGQWFLVGNLCRSLKVLFLKRESLFHRVTLLYELKKRLANDCVLVFPEGTTTDAVKPSLANWKRGQMWSVAQAGCRLVLAGLHYEDQAAAAWVGDTSLLPHLWNFLCGDGISVYVSIAEYENTDLMHYGTNQEKAQFSFEQLCFLCENSQSEAISCLSKPAHQSATQLPVPV
jgi:1-acyl-sn-glycerol-3-phosphate acyltransferase